MAKPLALAAALLLLVSCTSSADGQPTAASLEGLPGRWHLLEIPGAGDLLPQETAWRPWLEIRQGGAVSGHTGVNHLSAQLDPGGLRAGRFELGALATTEMAGPPEAMRLERRFVQDLGRAERYRLGGGELELLEGGEVLLRFTRAR